MVNIVLRNQQQEPHSLTVYIVVHSLNLAYMNVGLSSCRIKELSDYRAVGLFKELSH